ncbi:SDR family oxidoreductase [Ancylobacter sp. FA202]|uniref:SDR family oxidoreductase n=1 Tax=Ancylobacter sp. FA202 TaxID=1111106 RepID=UPI00036365D1|nr:SDR family oxidoreductase [Ancylobacter sp. FA202]
MQVFVTGATGFVGSAVTAELLAHGHQVMGLARSNKSADELVRSGAQVLRGDLEAPETLREGAQSCDAVLHAGFIHDFADYARCCAIDSAAIETLGAAIEGTGKPFIVTAGLAGLAVTGNAVTEDDVAPPPSEIYPRASDSAARALTARGIPTMILRLPPSVHGKGDHGFVPMLIQRAREKGRSAYVGAGDNAWPAVHVTDAARAYRVALERGPSADTFHAVGEQGVPFRAIAQAIAVGLNLTCVSLSPEEAREHFGWMARFTTLDQPTASERTRHVLGWHPTGPGLLTDIAEAGYFPVAAG